MHTSFKTFLAATALGLAAALPANAQLLLSGNAYGTFADPGVANTTVTNGPVVSTFASGVAYRAVDTQTSVQFTGDTFSNAGNGDRVDLGSLVTTNGRTLLGTTAKTASMDVYLNLPENGVTAFKLTTLHFSIDSTANNGSLIPDLFFVGHGDVNSLWVGGREVTFDLHFTNPEFSTGSGASIAEGSSALDGIYAYIHFTPVPEPSTYALWGAALLVGVVAIRRVRSTRASASVA